MAYLKTSEILEIVEDFFTSPIYEGAGTWNEIKGLIGEIKDNSLTGILNFSRLNERIVLFYDSGVFLEGLVFEGDRHYSITYNDFTKDFTKVLTVKSYGYAFYPHNSEILVIVSLISKSERILDSITPFIDKTIQDLTDLGFSGILRIYSPIRASMVFFSGIPYGVFSKGKRINIKEIRGDIYEMRAFSVEGSLEERNYEYQLSRFLVKINSVYSKMVTDEDTVKKFRKRMLSYAENEPLVEPLLGFVEPKVKEIAINLPSKLALRVLPTICDILMDVNPRMAKDIKSIKEELKNL